MRRRASGAALAAMAALVAGAPPASGEAFTLPAGLACAGFDLRVDGFEPREAKVFRDRDGRVVRTISTGRGSALTFTNEQSGSSLSLRANGAVESTTFEQDGTQAVAITGHTILILFPTDVPAGPSTTLHVGRVTYDVDHEGVFTVRSTAGRRLDICAALA